MELVTCQIDSGRAPTTGKSLYIIVEQGQRKVTLLHYATLSQLTIPADEFLSGRPVEHWPICPPGERPIDPKKVANYLETKAKELASMQRLFPAQVVRRAIAEFRGVKVADVAALRETVKKTVPHFAVKSEKRPGIIDAITEMLYKGATIDDMVCGLSEKFPERPADGMRTTVRCQINRLPKKLGMKMNISEDKKREGAKVFKLTS